MSISNHISNIMIIHIFFFGYNIHPSIEHYRMLHVQSCNLSRRVLPETTFCIWRKYNFLRIWFYVKTKDKVWQRKRCYITSSKWNVFNIPVLSLGSGQKKVCSLGIPVSHSICMIRPLNYMEKNLIPKAYFPRKMRAFLDSIHKRIIMDRLST